ncbi:hypothetical protein BEWA_020670 [Theileria equi strain WA]|uniref:RNA polymerase III subunit Rpc25 domain-containing protein n=1 Tax=Theileria equi strain WA TaxID=1537102 RepID=L0AUI6_THEEQ|nr:hypothetical protein BEWA_020670 [Theileria equi strain WA]AFZ79220.1 hypothetical protein BEWA_020670 [Theileria equi strain WA]|eukprot:XP_004828886.1 hypothetical protein BEWA_020670 [Theileria equi strain WA]
MFKIYLIEDYVTLKVSEYINDSNKILLEKLANKYIDRIIFGTGLCILLDDNLLKCEPRILPSEGQAHYKTHFRLLVFSPNINQILKGQIIDCDSESITLSLGFFSDIRVITSTLPPEYRYDKNAKCWSKITDSSRKIYRLNDIVDFRVVDIIYNRTPEQTGNTTAKQLPVMLVIAALTD